MPFPSSDWHDLHTDQVSDGKSIGCDISTSIQNSQGWRIIQETMNSNPFHQRGKSKGCNISIEVKDANRDAEHSAGSEALVQRESSEKMEGEHVLDVFENIDDHPLRDET
ncbi:hypothetical protein QAD02_017577 [Eretmocerus hayati]|uniref:Uncharacterized protein n=1 Tax=Eretmocerus hayati TaxID=131215 RepID=A0ACC2PEC7_9HYME|nr:hypothetical protein QAD02_017577 [Eretmocerus hayati]